MLSNIDKEDQPKNVVTQDYNYILHQLHPLYGFNVITDLVFDAMHNIPLNVANHHLQYYFNEGILSCQEVNRKLKKVQWTAGIYNVCVFYKCVNMYNPLH